MKYSKFLISKSNKNFLFHFNTSGGRNFSGRICVFHRGGGSFTHYRFIDFFRRINCFGFIVKIFKDISRTAFVGTVLYFNGLITNMLTPEDCRVGHMIFSGFEIKKDSTLAVGYTLPLATLPLFSLLYNIETKVFGGSKYARSAGVSALCISRVNNLCLLKLNSGWQVFVHQGCLASLGRSSNAFHKYLSLNKAGVSRRLGFRPVVRGVVKNPCDHPHGGGEGRGSPPAAQRSPWGKLTKGTPTTNTIRQRLLRRRFKDI